jgi:hypothetical protein
MLTRRIPLWVALAACLFCAAIGTLRAQDQKDKDEPKPPPIEYDYLPDHYSQPYIPTLAEWQAMRITALGASTTRLTENFTRQHLTCFTTPKGLVFTLDLVPQPEWTFALPGGKFSVPVEKVKPDLQKAIDASMRFVKNFFPEIEDKDVSMRLYLRSERIGVWENGKLTLEAEKKAE